MRGTIYVQTNFKYGDAIYPALYKILRYLAMLSSRVKVRVKRRKLKRK